MKLMLLIGGIAFLLLGLLLCVAALAVFMMARKRAGKQPATWQQPVPSSVGAPPPSPPALPVSPPMQSFAPAMDMPPRQVTGAYTLQPEIPPPAPQPSGAQPQIPFESTQAIPLADPEFMPGATIAVSIPEREEWGALNATSGPLAGRTFPLTRDGFYIGRDASASQVVIQDSSVSKRHVWVGVREGAVMAIDDGSTNGTYLNVVGTRITKQPLNPGDTLIISNDVTRLVYQR